MSLRSRPKSGASVSLFPFMAVLLCAMGALLLLLFALTEHARAIARRATAPETPAVDVLVEDLEFRTEIVRDANEKTAAQLAEKRLDLSLLEDQTRRIRDEIQKLEDSAAALQARRSEQSDTVSAEEIRQIEDRITDLRVKLEELREQGLQRSQSYAIVPYSGPNATRRRPIYVECIGDAVVFQPAGIRLGEDDFIEPLGPGNPLAAGLRAASEYLVSQGYRQDTVGEPYPLILVRQDGILPYAAARAAMKSWGSDFGYEFVPNDWRLEYQPVDPVMADVIRRAVDEARQRRQALMASAPRLYRGGRSAMRRDGDETGTMSSEGRYGGGPARSGGGDGATGAGSSAGRGNHEVSGGADGVTGGATVAATGTGTGSPASGSSGDASAASAGGAAGASPGGPSFPSGKPTTSGGARGAVARPGEYFDPPEKRSADEVESDQESLARSRGKDWGLPAAGRGSIPIARPIEIECRHDQLVIYPGRAGAGAMRRVPIPTDTLGAVDGLISSVWEQVESWGMAGRGMYWRPVLVLDVLPGGEHRYADLKQLLDGSGLEIQERLVAPPRPAYQLR